MVVVNNTKVVKARLKAKKDSGGKAEILVERVESDCIALCQVRVSKPLKTDRVLHCHEHDLRVLSREGEFYRVSFPIPVLEFLENYGLVPLPPYIQRENEVEDLARYQTVYAKKTGAVAAPTAGLHFDTALLNAMKLKGIQIHDVTLHIGAGTFQPLRRTNLTQHKLHSERYEVPVQAQAAIRECSGRVIAVGTTVVRALESWACTGLSSGDTELFITPGFEFKVTQGLITNFHLPKSSLLMLVAAFGGHERVLNAYQAAIEKQYRFFSYGDAMFLVRQRV